MIKIIEKPLKITTVPNIILKNPETNKIKPIGLRGLDKYEEIIPTVLEIPSKNYPYSIEKDSIMQKACRQLYGQNLPDDLK